MSMDRMMATYLVDESYLLHLQETQDGMEYHCFDTAEKTLFARGLLTWDVLDDYHQAAFLARARIAAFEEIGLEGKIVAMVSTDMLEQMRGGRKLLGEIRRDEEVPEKHSIRFINSRYDDLFKIPDGGMVEVQYPDRKFSVRCEYMDDYHLRLGYEVLHICQLAEMLERSNGTCRPEPIITEEQCAWSLGRKGFLSVQTCEDGYDYTLYDQNYREVDGGQLDNPEMSMNEARNAVLEDYGMGGRTMTPMDYDELLEHAEAAEAGARESVLGRLGSITSREASAPKAPGRTKEAER